MCFDLFVFWVYVLCFVWLSLLVLGVSLLTAGCYFNWLYSGLLVVLFALDLISGCLCGCVVVWVFLSFCVLCLDWCFVDYFLLLRLVPHTYGLMFLWLLIVCVFGLIWL